jgi:hypothetical protein
VEGVEIRLAQDLSFEPKIYANEDEMHAEERLGGDYGE